MCNNLNIKKSKENKIIEPIFSLNLEWQKAIFPLELKVKRFKRHQNTTKQQDIDTK